MALSIDKEEDNFLRFFKLLNGPGTEAVRIIFDSFFPNNTLDVVLRREENNIRRRASHWRITQKQLDLLFPAIGIALSKEFDITLMVGLIRNFCRTIGHAIIPTSKDWESLPAINDVTIGDDLIRIKFHRNEIAHSGDDTLDTHTFKCKWTIVKEAISRLSGTSLDQKCNELEKMILDTVSELRKEIRTLQTNMTEYVNELRIPGRDAHSLELESWEKANETFVKTDAVDAVMNSLQSENCITILGSFGQGKSSLIQHVALRFRDEKGYNIIPCRTPMEIVTWYQRDKNQMFIVDDLYGERCLMFAKLETWKDHAKFIKLILNQGQVKIIASSRFHIFNVANSQIRNKEFQFVLNMNKFPLTNMQKEKILNMHIPFLEDSDIKSILEIDNADILEHFPLLCLMCKNYSSISNEKVDVYDFFCNRRDIHDEFLENLRKHDKNAYTTILIYVLLNGNVSQNEYSKEKRFQKQAVKLTALTKYLAIKKTTFYECLDNLTGTYFTKSRGMFLPIHNTILVTLLEFTARVSQEIIIQHWNSGLLFTHSHFKSIDVCETNYDQLISVSPENEHIFFQRMLDNIHKRKCFKVFKQDNMNNTVFRQKFIRFIRIKSSKDNKLVKRILNTIDEAKLEDSLPMLPIQIASFYGWSDMVEMLVSYVDVNFYGIVGFSPLFAACESGDYNTVKVLIDNNADVNKTSCTGHILSAVHKSSKTTACQCCSNRRDFQSFPEQTELSPLYIAVVAKHKSVAELLLKNGASMNMDPNIYRKNFERCPMLSEFKGLFNHPGFLLTQFALMNNDMDMVNLLVQYRPKLADTKDSAFEIPLD